MNPLQLCVGLYLDRCGLSKIQRLYFSAQIPQNLPCSVTLQPGPEDTGKVTHTYIQPFLNVHCGTAEELVSQYDESVRSPW